MIVVEVAVSWAFELLHNCYVGVAELVASCMMMMYMVMGCVMVYSVVDGVYCMM